MSSSARSVDTGFALLSGAVLRSVAVVMIAQTPGKGDGRQGPRLWSARRLRLY
jgi:hypothetical protein